MQNIPLFGSAGTSKQQQACCSPRCELGPLAIAVQQCCESSVSQHACLVVQSSSSAPPRHVQQTQPYVNTKQQPKLVFNCAATIVSMTALACVHTASILHKHVQQKQLHTYCTNMCNKSSCTAFIDVHSTCVWSQGGGAQRWLNTTPTCQSRQSMARICNSYSHIENWDMLIPRPVAGPTLLAVVNSNTHGMIQPSHTSSRRQCGHTSRICS